MSYSFKKKRLEFDFSRKNKELKRDILYSRPYQDFYSLKTAPFTVTPDPEFLYSSSTHKDAIEKIIYGIGACMGFILLIGEVGTGKTTLCRAILDELEGRAETVYIINPSLSGFEILQAILDDLGLDYQAGSSKKDLLDRLNCFLLEVTIEKPVVIIIDDAQTMTPEGLENIRLLSNLETDKKKLLQLVLAGQQELQELLLQPELRQLKQRITICCQLDHIGYDELKKYILLRLFVAGDKGKINFSEAAIKEIYKASHGIPRLINIICDYTLTAGYITNSLNIKKIHARMAINELRQQSLVDETFLSRISSYLNQKRVWLELLILFIGIILLFFLYNGKMFDPDFQLITTQPESKPLYIADPSASNNGNAEKKADTDLKLNNRKDSSVLDSKALSEDAKGSAFEIPEKYIVQISSVKTRQAAIHEVTSLRKRGFDVRWNAVHFIEDGIWYRIYKGGFSTKKEAIVFKKDNGFPEAIVIYAPWTIIVSSKNQTETSEEVYSILKKKGLDCTMEMDGNTGYRITSGAFISNERAQKATLEILDMGLDATPLLR